MYEAIEDPCRTWFAKMTEASEGIVKHVLPDDLHNAIPELVLYFQHSFGNVTRLDYGTGHETTFVAFLYCLAALSKHAFTLPVLDSIIYWT